MKWWRGLLFLGLLAAGCTPAGGRRVEAPSLSPADAAEKALAEYDANKDGVLDAKELEKCPALKSALPRFDANSDGKLSKREIEDKLQGYRDSKTGIVAVPCRVLVDGRAMSGLSVTFEPESFLGPSFKPATGTTEDDGTVSLRTEGYDVEGLPFGLYRVKVSKKNAGGQEAIPARYNTQTTLGQEIGPDMRGDIVIKVTQR